VFSAYPKVTVQTTPWTTDLFFVAGDFEGYMALQQLPANTLVYPICSKDSYIIGLDKLSLAWDKDIVSSRDEPINKDPNALHALLAGRRYRWAIADFNCITLCMRKDSLPKDKCRLMFAQTLKGLEDSKLFKRVGRSNSTSTFEVL